MSEEPQQLPAPSQSITGSSFIPLLVFFGALALLLMALLPASPATLTDTVDLSVAEKPTEAAAEPTHEHEATEAPALPTYADNARIQLIEPADGQEVNATFTAVFQAVNVTVEPAGELHDNAGHFHVLIDVPFIEPGEIIPNDEAHRHFGDGSLSAEFTLSPGEHTLRLQFADGAHRALEGDSFRDEITITVVEG